MKRNNGFTVIELMAVVAIVSILAVLALSAYLDYVVRSKVAEGMGFAAEAKTAVSNYYYTQRDWPQTNQDAGLPPAAAYSRYSYLESLTIQSIPRPGTIVVTFSIPGSTADGRELHLSPLTQTRELYWSCYSPADNALEVSQIPANCRAD